MFESMPIETLQAWWWLIIAVLGGLLVMLTFVQGGQTLLWTVGPDARSRTLLVNALGRKWELTFTTLVTFGGAMFAAFPLFYATSFSGAYWAWMSLLLCFVLQAVAYEYRTKPGNLFGARGYEGFLWLNGSLGVFLLGVIVGTLFTGAPFTVDEANLSHWAGPARGLEALAEPFNVAFGLLLVVLARVLGALFFLVEVDDAPIRDRARRVLRRESAALAVLVVAALVWLMQLDGLAWDPQSGAITVVAHKYLDNLLALPLRALAPLVVGALGLGLGVGRGWKDRPGRSGFWFAAGGAALVGLALFSLAGLNHTAFYPSTAQASSSLTLANASSSRYTLTVMSYVSLIIPFVLAYVVYVWRQMSARPLTHAELDDDPMSY